MTDGRLTVGSLFAGIGGFDLGLERAGMRTVWFCEQDAFCQRVLAKHWPGVPCYPDVRALVADTGCERGATRRDGGDVATSHGDSQSKARQWERARDAAYDGRAARTNVEDRAGSFVSVQVPYVDVLCGGFPCQGTSFAGRGLGLADLRSGLWSEYARLIGELRPRYVIVENVAALLARGLGTVLGDLAALGYDAEWDCIPASAVGAPHRRDRVWIVAAGATATRSERERAWASSQPGRVGHANGTSADAYTTTSRSWSAVSEPGWWLVEPDVGRVANGIPNRVDRLRSLGNALVPQIAEWLGRRIMEYEMRATA